MYVHKGRGCVVSDDSSNPANLVQLIVGVLQFLRPAFLLRVDAVLKLLQYVLLKYAQNTIYNVLLKHAKTQETMSSTNTYMYNQKNIAIQC